MSYGGATRANEKARKFIEREIRRLRRKRARTIGPDTIAHALNEAHRSRCFTPGRVAALLREREDVKCCRGIWEILPQPGRAARSGPITS